MNPKLTIVAVVFSLTAAGCSTLWSSTAPDLPQAAQVGVYESFPPSDRDYVLVRRLWVDGWTSALGIPRYASVEAGAADLRNHAALLGGNAIMNFGCYHSAVDPRSDYYCNGNVIRYVR